MQIVSGIRAFKKPFAIWVVRLGYLTILNSSVSVQTPHTSNVISHEPWRGNSLKSHYRSLTIFGRGVHFPSSKSKQNATVGHGICIRIEVALAGGPINLDCLMKVLGTGRLIGLDTILRIQ